MNTVTRILAVSGLAGLIAAPALTSGTSAAAAGRRTPIWIATATALAATATATPAATHPATTASAQPSRPETATIRLWTPEAPPGAVTQVEWQDGLGQWHPVPGWRGRLAAEWPGAAWAVLPEHFGQGPFRWRLEDPLNHVDWCSPAFWLPAQAGDSSDTWLTTEGVPACD